MLHLDGSHGEGGGQLLRLAVGLSGVTGRPVRVENIRAARPKPGLAAQHLAAVRAAAALCGAEVRGAGLGSTTLEFVPGRPRGGEYRFAVGTAGSVTLVLQAALPVALAAAGYLRAPEAGLARAVGTSSESESNRAATPAGPGRRRPRSAGAAPVEGEAVTLHVSGGTDVAWSPPVDWWRAVFLGHLRRAGLAAEQTIKQRGYYPKGGGAVTLRLEPASAPLGPLQLAMAPQGSGAEGSGAPTIASVAGVAYTGGLPDHVADRMAKAARRELFELGGPTRIKIRKERGPSFNPGGGLVLWTGDGLAQQSCASPPRPHTWPLTPVVHRRRAPRGGANGKGKGEGKGKGDQEGVGGPAGDEAGAGAKMGAAWAAPQLLGHGELARRGRPAEDVGRASARKLWAQVTTDAAVDRFAADQLLLYLALTDGGGGGRGRDGGRSGNGVPDRGAGGPGGGSYTVAEVTQHTRTAAWVIQQFLPVRFTTERLESIGCYRVVMEPVSG